MAFISWLRGLWKRPSQVQYHDMDSMRQLVSELVQENDQLQRDNKKLRVDIDALNIDYGSIEADRDKARAELEAKRVTLRQIRDFCRYELEVKDKP